MDAGAAYTTRVHLYLKLYSSGASSASSTRHEHGRGGCVPPWRILCVCHGVSALCRTPGFLNARGRGQLFMYFEGVFQML